MALSCLTAVNLLSSSVDDKDVRLLQLFAAGMRYSQLGVYLNLGRRANVIDASEKARGRSRVRR